MTSLVVDHQYTRLFPATEQEEAVIELVDGVTSWMEPGAWHSPLYQAYRRQQRGEEVSGPVWDGKRHLLTKKRLKFPTGLLGRVVVALQAKGILVQLEEQRVYPAACREIVELEGIELRDYQIEAVGEGIKFPTGIFSLPPGVGKTEILIALTASLKVFPVLWLTHERVLLNQTYDRYRERLDGHAVTIGKAGEGSWDLQDVTIATVQTMTSRLKEKVGRDFLRKVQVVISDEVHHEPSGTWNKILMKCPAPFRYGCSATPLLRADGSSLRLIGAVGEVIYELSSKVAVDAGVLSRPRIVLMDYDPEGVSTDFNLEFATWQEVYSDGIVNNRVRNKCILDITKRAVEEGRRVLILIRRLWHGKLLSDSLEEWFDCSDHIVFLQGASPTSVREEAVKLFRKGVVKIIIASSIFDEGVDIPEVDTVIIAAAGKSAIKSIQRVGRGMRQSGSEHELRVYDFIDRCSRHLRAHSGARKKAYKSMGLGKIEIVKGKS